MLEVLQFFFVDNPIVIIAPFFFLGHLMDNAFLIEQLWAFKKIIHGICELVC
jgi:hypothetical protein